MNLMNTTYSKNSIHLNEFEITVESNYCEQFGTMFYLTILDTKDSCKLIENVPFIFPDRALAYAVDFISDVKRYKKPVDK